MTLRTDIEARVASWPHSQARSAVRVADVLNGKDASYWSRVGRERVDRELAEDGLPPERIDAVILMIEGAPSENIDLSQVLADLVAREGRP